MSAVIRLAGDGDAAAVAAIYAPFVDGNVTSFEAEPPSEDEMRRRIAETVEMYPWLVCDCNGVIAGYAYAAWHRTRLAYRWSVETSVYVHSDFRRRGVARGLYTSLFAVLAAQGYVNAYAGITLPNARSVAFHEALGFLPLTVYRGIGFKLGQWHDVGWWHLLLRRHPATPENPTALDDLRGQPGWEALVSAGEPLVRTRS